MAHLPAPALQKATEQRRNVGNLKQSILTQGVRGRSEFWILGLVRLLMALGAGRSGGLFEAASASLNCIGAPNGPHNTQLLCSRALCLLLLCWYAGVEDRAKYLQTN